MSLATRRFLPFSIAVLALAIVLAAAPRLARAADEAARIAVKIEGRGAEDVREVVLAVVPEGVSVAEEDEFSAALARAGLPGGRMAYAITSPRMRGPLLKIVRRAVTAEELSGAVIGRVQARRGKLELVLLYVEPEGDPLVDTAVPLPDKPDQQESALREALGVVLEELAPEPEPEPEEEPEPVEPEPEEEEDEGEFEENRPGSELFSVELDFGLGGRFFNYSESATNSGNLRPYDTFGTPIIFVGGELYPAATTGIVVLRDLGLSLSYAQPFGLGSRSEDGQYTFDTTWHRFWVGLVYRVRIGEADDLPVVLSPSVKLGVHNFMLEPADAISEQIEGELPTVEYLLLRLGLDARLPVGKHFAVLAGLGYAAPLRGAGLYERFSGASLAGLDAGLGFAIPIDLGFELRVGGEYTALFSSFEPEPGDVFVAESATDHFLMLRLGMAYVY